MDAYLAGLFYLLVINLVTAGAYGYDKHLAVTGARRLRERTLHLLGLIGGTPGGFAGQRLFRHKTRDRSFQLVFRMIVGLQVAALLAILWLCWR